MQFLHRTVPACKSCVPPVHAPLLNEGDSQMLPPGGGLLSSEFRLWVPACTGSGLSKLPSRQSTHTTTCLIYSSDPELAFVLLWPPWGFRRA